MYRSKQIAVVIPCLNEEKQIELVISTMPEFVDYIVIVDDYSTDKTVEKVSSLMSHNKKIVLLRNEKSEGIGGSMSKGYIWCRDNGVDIAVRMDGDGQMDPQDMSNLVSPVIEGKADYSKGNRLITGEAWNKIPHVRYLGNAALTLMTKIASGYWHVTDSQTGYTALGKRGLHALPLDDIYRDYGMPNDFLVTLNIYDMKVMDVMVNPLYGVGEKSKMVIPKKIYPLFKLMVRLFFKRMIRKYIIRDFHPLIFFYFMSLLIFSISLPIWYKVIYTLATTGSVLRVGFPAALLITILGFQFLFFAMWFDMDYNRELNPRE